MRRIQIAAALLLCTLPLQAQDAGTLESTVKSIILADNPMISFASQEYQYLYETTEKQVSAIFANHIKTEVRDSIYQTLPFSPNEILLKVAEGQTFEQETTTDGLLKTNIDALNTLITEYEIASIKPFSFPGMYLLSFKADENPRLLAKQLAEVEAIEWAEINSQMGRDGLAIRKLSPILFVLNIGWGDCPAGCIYSSRTYIEAYSGSGETQFIGRGGDELEADLVEKIFIAE